MYYQTLKAHFDGKQVVLDEPVAFHAGTPLLVLVAKEETFEEERAAWFEMSAAGLAQAYGPDEPDYSSAIEQRLPKEESSS